MRRRRRILGISDASRGSFATHPEVHGKEALSMRTPKEFPIRQDDKPGTLGKRCKALADQNVNILAYQSFAAEKGKSAVRLVLDNVTTGKTVLDRQREDYTETEVAQVKLAHRPGELARAASR